MYVSLTDIKKHLNIDESYTGDDSYLTDLILVAESVIAKHIDSNLDSLEDGEGNLPSPLIHAIKLFVGNMYANRESVAFAQSYNIPNSYDYLLSLYKNYLGVSATS
jgi:uncharacterized phage protein (predicted DNA packaging)